VANFRQVHTFNKTVHDIYLATNKNSITFT